ncbi:MAG: YbfB/YjiJ family MFS transporter [Acetobacteraceae bacterium]|nr:YbfB/YjiJ family MFS transporter [Acetobacteraceae bacterium]
MRQSTTDTLGPTEASAWRATLSGLCASLVGIGLARFAYTPLLPAIIGAGWFDAAAAAYLGAANLAGYLAGALSAGPVVARISARTLLRGAMLVASGSFLACAWPGGFLWFFAWRFISGVAGGAAMVLAAPAILPHVAVARRGLVSGGIFVGVGVGIAASGTLVPLLLRAGLQEAWLGLGAAALALTAAGWNGWPAQGPAAPKSRSALPPSRARALRALYAVYGLNAFGLVPHMVFLVDFVSRGLGRGLDAGSGYWVLFGMGAMAGPLVTGLVADRIGFRSTLRLALLLEAVAVALPGISHSPAGLVLSCLVVGACTPGVVPLALGRTQEILRDHASAQKRAWSAATTSFAVMQAAGAYGLSFVFIRSGGDYRLLFGIGAATLALALAVDLLASEGREPY